MCRAWAPSSSCKPVHAGRVARADRGGVLQLSRLSGRQGRGGLRAPRPRAPDHREGRSAARQQFGAVARPRQAARHQERGVRPRGVRASDGRRSRSPSGIRLYRRLRPNRRVELRRHVRRAQCRCRGSVLVQARRRNPPSCGRRLFGRRRRRQGFGPGRISHRRRWRCAPWRDRGRDRCRVAEGAVRPIGARIGHRAHAVRRLGHGARGAPRSGPVRRARASPQRGEDRGTGGRRRRDEISRRKDADFRVRAARRDRAGRVDRLARHRSGHPPRRRAVEPVPRSRDLGRGRSARRVRRPFSTARNSSYGRSTISAGRRGA